MFQGCCAAPEVIYGGKSLRRVYITVGVSHHVTRCGEAGVILSVDDLIRPHSTLVTGVMRVVCD